MKQNHKGFVVPLVIAIVAVLAIGGAVYYSKNKTAVTPQTTTDTSVPTVQTTQVTQNKVETTNWKTYKNDKFEFKYPAEWHYRILNQANINDTVQLFSPEAWVEAQKGDRDGATNFMAFEVWKTDAYVKDIKGSNVTIAGKSAIDTGWRLSEVGTSPLRRVRFFVEPPVSIEMIAQSDTKIIEEKILSTFKFVK